MGKYMEEASRYSSGVETYKTHLEETMNNLKKIDNSLGFNENDAKDMLTYNVIVSNQEIQSEIESLVSNLDNYTNIITTKAKEIDLEEERERIEREKLEKARLAKGIAGENIIHYVK